MYVKALATPMETNNRRIMMLIWALVIGAVLAFVQATQSAAQLMPNTFADLAEDVSPAVVNITTTSTVAARTAPENAPRLPPGSPFEDLFRDFFDQNGPQRPRRGNALGSGFIISEDGFVITNNHVIEDADEITIELFEGGELKATLIGTDPEVDIALLKVDSDEPLPFVEFGDSDIARVGDWVMAVGNPLGQGFSVSTGIISARNRELNSGAYDDFIQTDAAINQGNSGGPLFNLDGEVIGVNTAIISTNGGSIGLGFSMSANVVQNVVGQLMEFGETRRGWLGVRIQDLDAEIAEALGLDGTNGALVSAVPEGPAAEAGIEAQDVIMSFDGKEITDTRELIRIVGATQVGKTVQVVVFRNGQETILDVTLARREDQFETVPAALPNDEPQETELLGVQVSSLTPEIRERLGLSNSKTGVMVMNVEQDSDAFEKGLRPGDLITEVGPMEVTSPADVEKAISDAREAGRMSVLLLVEREGNPRFVALSIAG